MIGECLYFDRMERMGINLEAILKRLKFQHLAPNMVFHLPKDKPVGVYIPVCGEIIEYELKGTQKNQEKAIQKMSQNSKRNSMMIGFMSKYKVKNKERFLYYLQKSFYFPGKSKNEFIQKYLKFKKSYQNGLSFGTNYVLKNKTL